MPSTTYSCLNGAKLSVAFQLATHQAVISFQPTRDFDVFSLAATSWREGYFLGRTWYAKSSHTLFCLYFFPFAFFTLYFVFSHFSFTFCSFLLPLLQIPPPPNFQILSFFTSPFWNVPPNKIVLCLPPPKGGRDIFQKALTYPTLWSKGDISLKLQMSKIIDFFFL